MVKPGFLKTFMAAPTPDEVGDGRVWNRFRDWCPKSVSL